MAGQSYRLMELEPSLGGYIKDDTVGITYMVYPRETTKSATMKRRGILHHIPASSLKAGVRTTLYVANDGLGLQQQTLK